MKQLGIYKIRNVVNQKFYVGSSNDIKDRFRQHRKLLRGNRHHCKHLQAAWNKYGEECFKFEVVDVITEEAALFAAEDAWLREWVGKELCYNSGRSADAPMRGAFGALHPSFGVPVSAEQRARISETLKVTYAANPENHPRLGKKHTPETLAKIAANRTAPTGENHYRYGKTVSPEVRAKIGAAQRGVKKAPRTYSPEGRAIAQATMRANAREQVPAAFAEVHAKFPTEVQEKYDFSKAVYTGALTRIEGCVCPIHGVFSQYAAQFRKGRGCPECGGEQRAESKRKQMKEAWGDIAERAKMLAARKKS